MGSQEEGSPAGSVSRRPPCTPACGTALKSCGVCHRSASPRMRKGKVGVFFFFFSSCPPPPHPPPAPSFSSRLWFCNLIFFFLRTPGERGVRREGGRGGGSWPGGPGGGGGGTRSLRSVSLSAGCRIAWKVAASSQAPPPPHAVRFRAASADRAPSPLPDPDRPPPAARSPAPPAPAPNEEVGSHAGHGPPELKSLSEAPGPRVSSPFSLERRGGKRGTNQKRERRGWGGETGVSPGGSRASSPNPPEAEL